MKDKYQVFISCKCLNEKGEKTQDSIIAERLYEYLSVRGISVFFSNISLEKSGTATFKKAIDEALDSSQIVVAVGTCYDNLNSEYVRYEWDSFFNDILGGFKPHGRVFALIDDNDLSKLPHGLRYTQTFFGGQNSFADLYRYIINSLEVSGERDLDVKKVPVKALIFALKRVSGSGPGEVTIPYKKTVTFGKKEDNDVVLPSNGVSRYHARITFNDEGIFLRDLDSKNGTFMNGERIKSREIKVDDIMAFADVVYKLCCPLEEDETETLEVEARLDMLKNM
jgi:hypothetical protein